MIQILIILLSIFAQTQAELSCKHLFTKEYLVFFYREQTPKISIHREINFGNNEIVTGNILTSICNEVDIPESCGESGKAKLVFVTETGKCSVIIRHENSWNYSQGTFETNESFEYGICRCHPWCLQC